MNDLARSFLFFMFGAFALASAFADDEPPATDESRIEISTQLHEALFRGDEAGPGCPALLLELRRTGGRWQRVLGVAKGYNCAVHSGRVLAASISEGSMSFQLDIKIAADSYAPGGSASYTVNLSRGQEDEFEGNFTGAFRDKPVEGKARAVIIPPRRRVVTDYTPVQPGEHPRILFRKSDLPRLREKMKTPFGQTAMVRLGSTSGDGDIVGMGLKYQLTGDAQHAEQAIPFVEKRIARGLTSDQFGNNVGDRMEKVALTYDLCYNAWSPEFTTKVEDYLAWASRSILFHQKALNRSINWHVCSNWSAPLYTGVGFAGLALWMEKGDKPVKPEEPKTGATVPPAREYSPGEGVPVAKFVDGEMPGDWIYTGGFKPEQGEDPLAGLGGVAGARPEIGSTVGFRGRSERFRILSHDPDKGYWRNPGFMRGKDMIDITNAIGRAYFSTSYFFSVIENDESRWVEVLTGYGPATVYLNGVPFREGECASLEKGMYPIMVVAPIQWTDPWGRHLMQPRLIERSSVQAAALVARRMAQYREQVEEWHHDEKEWKRLGGTSVEYMKLFEMGRLMMYLHYREAVGTGGFQAEIGHYSSNATRPASRYAAAYRNMFGEDVSPYDDITHFVPRKMFAHLYKSGGTAVTQDINGTPEVNPDFFASLFPVIPPEWKPAALWGWRRHADLKEGETSFGGLLDSEPVHTFLNYPLDMKPEHPSGGMPLTWKAPDFGYYAFRDRWEGNDDFVVQVFAKAHHIGGWNGPNAGTFRVLGLGHTWACGPTDRNRSRWEENVVMLPEDPEINLSACGRVTHFDGKTDGSGVLTIDMNDVYAASQPAEGDGKRPRLYEPYGNIRIGSSFRNSEITGLRSLAVDYSGKSSAPCLLAVVDKISGGGAKIWTWQLGGSEKKGEEADSGNLSDTRVRDNAFTIGKPDGATLHGTFIAPRDPKLTAEVRQTFMIGGGGSSKGKTLNRPIAGVFGEGRDSFFVVVTIQRGEPPAVTVEGSGLNARVTIGKQTVSFDGEKIVLGE